MIYRVRSIRFAGRKCGVVLQLQNGPCPIIAIANVLSLRGHIDLVTPPKQPPPPSPSVSSSRSSISFSELVDLLSAYLRSSVLSAVVDDHAASAHEEQILANSLANFEEVSALLPGLERGLDVNVVFAHCTQFEYSREIALFDLCKIRLLHGWVVDSRDQELVRVLRGWSFNEATTFVLSGGAQPASSSSASSAAPAAPGDVERVRAFLQSSASQLTDAGLAALHEVLRPGELCVLFRNNHFAAALLTADGRLLCLCTDEGLVDSAPRIAWMELVDTHGNDVMLNEAFAPATQGPRTPSPQPTQPPASSPALPAAYLAAASPYAHTAPAHYAAPPHDPRSSYASVAGQRPQQPYQLQALYRPQQPACAPGSAVPYHPPLYSYPPVPPVAPAPAPWHQAQYVQPRPNGVSAQRKQAEERDDSCCVM